MLFKTRVLLGLLFKMRLLPWVNNTSKKCSILPLILWLKRDIFKFCFLTGTPGSGELQRLLCWLDEQNTGRRVSEAEEISNAAWTDKGTVCVWHKGETSCTHLVLLPKSLAAVQSVMWLRARCTWRGVGDKQAISPDLGWSLLVPCRLSAFFVLLSNSSSR